MRYDASVKPNDYFLLFGQGISLLRVKKSHPLFSKWFFEHYPKSKGIVGRQLNYLIYYNREPCGIISATSPPLNYKLFADFFGVGEEKKYLNNSVFRIVKSPIKNFATRVLKIFRRRVFKDYLEVYGDVLYGLVTFVEKPRTGNIYKADNWVLLGETKGIEVRRRGENWLTKQYKKTGKKKLVFAYKYRRGIVNEALKRRNQRT